MPVSEAVREVVHLTLQRVSTVATLPSSAIRILGLAENPATTEEMLHAVLESDPALAARVLKVVNSAFYGRPRPVASTHAAMRLLGMNAIRTVAMAASLNRLFRGGRTVPGFDAAALWTHSVAVGFAARRIATLTRAVSAEEALLAGLLHDIGLLVAVQGATIEFSAVISATAADPERSFRDAEREFIGATHEALGEGLCERWRFPTTVAATCGYHHAPDVLPDDDRALPTIVHIADVIAARARQGFSRTVDGFIVDPMHCAFVGLSAADLAEVESELAFDVTAAMAIFD